MSTLRMRCLPCPRFTLRIECSPVTSRLQAPTPEAPHSVPTSHRACTLPRSHQGRVTRSFRPANRIRSWAHSRPSWRSSTPCSLVPRGNCYPRDLAPYLSSITPRPLRSPSMPPSKRICASASSRCPTLAVRGGASGSAGCLRQRASLCSELYWRCSFVMSGGSFRARSHSRWAPRHRSRLHGPSRFPRPRPPRLRPLQRSHRSLR